MLSQSLTRSIAAVAAAIAVAGGAYGIVSATSSSGAGTASAATPAPAAPGQVIPFTPGQLSPPQIVGQVPPGWSTGSGTIITGPAADQAEAAAVAAYPGGTVNRVLLLSTGDYVVHVIAVNWPHHVFVNPDFQVIGAA